MWTRSSSGMSWAFFCRRGRGDAADPHQPVHDKKRLKRGGGQKRLDWNRLEVADDASDEDLIAIDEALQSLTAEYPVCGELVKLRFFAGLYSRPSGGVLGNWRAFCRPLLVVCEGVAL